MVDLKLEIGEGILLQTTDAGRYDGDNEIEIDELYLTNKNLICVYEKSNGFFAKSETVVDKIPLTSIAVVNGVVQIEQVDDDDYGKSLQIIYTNGHRELLEINVSPKKQYPIWKAAMSDAVLIAHNGGARTQVAQPEEPVVVQTPAYTEVPVERTETKKTDKIFGAAASGLFAGFKGVADTVKQSFSEVTEGFKTPSAPQTVSSQQQPPVVASVEASVPANEVKHSFCSNCGTKLNEGSKFCHGCGAAVGVVTPPPIETPTPVVQPVVDQPQNNPNERRQEFVGKILKCPHCGATINERTVICPDCGNQITGKAAVSSVQSFKEQLMEIESHRKKTFGGMFGVYATADPADKQKLSLIRNFPIPNTIDDILEFVMLAIANIDVSVSKKTWANSSQGMEVLAMEMPRVISNAWVSKLQQAYQKAEIMFPNEPTFVGIQKLYFDKMKELKIKVN